MLFHSTGIRKILRKKSEKKGFRIYFGRTKRDGLPSFTQCIVKRPALHSVGFIFFLLLGTLFTLSFFAFVVVFILLILFVFNCEVDDLHTRFNMILSALTEQIKGENVVSMINVHCGSNR